MVEMEALEAKTVEEIEIAEKYSNQKIALSSDFLKMVLTAPRRLATLISIILGSLWMSNSRPMPTWTGGESNPELPVSKPTMIPFHHRPVMVGLGSVARATLKIS